MTKLYKKLIVTSLLAFCLAVCMCLFGACTETVTPEDNAVTYTVTVMQDETTPAKEVGVQIRKGSARYEKKTTDANGKAEFALAPDSYEVELSALPAHYGVPESATLSLTASNRDLTVTLAKNFAYVVKLVNPDGTAYYAEGVDIIMCTLTGNCLAPVALEEGGIAMIENVAKGDYHVKVSGLPEGAVVECDADGYYTGKNFSATETEMTITVYSVNVNSVNAATPMTDAEKTAYAQECITYTADNALTAYHFKEHLAAGAAAYYSITPEFNGDYSIYSKNGGSANYLYNGTEFTLENKGDAIFSVLPHMQAGKTFFFQVFNNGEAAADFEFVIEAPAASYTQIKLFGEVDVTIAKEGAAATIEFMPSIGAAIKLTGPADIDTSIILQAPGVKHETYAKNAECSARFTEERVGTTGILNFSVAVNNVSEYPVTFKVKVEKTANLTNITTVKHATAGLSQFGAQEGTLTDVPVDGTAVLVYNETDKFYHLNTQDGPVVVVSLNAPLAGNRFRTIDGSKLAYIDLDNGKFSLIVDTTKDKNSLTAGNTYNDYCLMLRGFTSYEAVPNNNGGFDLKIPEDIKEERYYVKYVNEDGVYPLTKELEAFLKEFAAVYTANVQNAAAGSEWLFACKYYTQEITNPGDKDAVVGEYEFESHMVYGDETKVGDQKEIGWDDDKQESIMGTVTKDDYKLVVDKNNTFTIYELADDEYEELDGGSWSNKDGVYTFTIPNPWGGDIAYTITFNSETGEITLNDSDEEVWKFILKAQA